MIRQILLAAALFTIVGCTENPPPRTASQSTGSMYGNADNAQLAAYAANANLPDNLNPRNDLQVAAIIDRNTGAINLYNFTDKPLAGGNIWVNRNYVQRFNSIPARSHTALPRDKFFDKNGQSLGSGTTPPDSVLLQWDNDVYQLLGPVFQ